MAVTERGTFFGYGDLVVDQRNFARLREATDCPAIFDATHSVQQPGRAADGASGGLREHIPALLAAAAAAGADGFFVETHPDPDRARCPTRRRSGRSIGSTRWWSAPSRCGTRRGSTPVFDATIAKRIRLLGLDVDGVLTENDAWIGEIDGARAEFKRFNIQDGFGIRLLAGSGIDVAWLTGRQSPVDRCCAPPSSRWPRSSRSRRTRRCRRSRPCWPSEDRLG